MRFFVKVCGLTSVEAVETCLAVGVDAIGFVFTESPRRVTPGQAARLAAAAPASVLRVAVFREPDVSEIARVLSVFPADVVQADHGALFRVDAPALLPVYREGSPGPDDTVARFLYEGPFSGVGQEVDRTLAARLAGRGEMILAGGLDPSNVGDAIATVLPFGVDVSSGVESRPGVKDPRRIEEFVAAVRAAEERLVWI